MINYNNKGKSNEESFYDEFVELSFQHKFSTSLATPPQQLIPQIKTRHCSENMDSYCVTKPLSLTPSTHRATHLSFTPSTHRDTHLFRGLRRRFKRIFVEKIDPNRLLFRVHSLVTLDIWVRVIFRVWYGHGNVRPDVPLLGKRGRREEGGGSWDWKLLDYVAVAVEDYVNEVIGGDNLANSSRITNIAIPSKANSPCSWTSSPRKVRPSLTPNTEATVMNDY